MPRKGAPMPSTIVVLHNKINSKKIIVFENKWKILLQYNVFVFTIFELMKFMAILWSFPLGATKLIVFLKDKALSTVMTERTNNYKQG